jgi:predicted DNA-binding antitoxin AbrB/MazE fold protein
MEVPTMTQTIEAVYEDGVFKPLRPVSLPEHQRVSIAVSLPTSENSNDVLKSWQKVFSGLTREEVAEVEAIALDRHNFMGHGE